MSDAAQSHGMNGRLTRADWPPLTLAEARDVLSDFPSCGSAEGITGHSQRPFSAACLVETTSDRVFLKRHHGLVRNAHGLAEEHAFMTHLLRRGFPVPRVYRAAHGVTAVTRDQWTYEVHTVAEGFDAYADAFSWTPYRCSAHARAAGTMLAHLHRASEGFEAPARSAQPLVGSFSIFAQNGVAAGLKSYIAGRPALTASDRTRHNAANAMQMLEPLYAELKPLLGALAPLWTHNDLHASNIFWSSEDENAHGTALVDFGLCDRTNAVHDLAVAIERSMIEWLHLPRKADGDVNLPVHFDQLEALLSGYETVRPLRDEEANALAPMLALCHVEFALSEADYLLGVIQDPQKARMADDWYLLGHARWFRSRHGVHLLNYLRAWAEQREARAQKAASR